MGEATVADGLLNCKHKVNTYRNSLCKSQAHFPSSENEKPFFSSVLTEKIFVAPRSQKADSPSLHPVDLFQRKKELQDTQRLLSAKLFAQQAPAGLVTNEGEKGIEEEMLCMRLLFISTSMSEVPAKYSFADGFD